MQRILVFTKTTGYRHDSIPAGVTALRELAAELGWELDHSEDASDFTAENLARYGVVVWLDVSGDVLESAERERDYAAEKISGAKIHIAVGCVKARWWTAPGVSVRVRHPADARCARTLRHARRVFS